MGGRGAAQNPGGEKLKGARCIINMRFGKILVWSFLVQKNIQKKKYFKLQGQ